MSGTDEKPPKRQKLSDITKRFAPTRGFANVGNGDSESSSHEDDSDEFSLNTHRRKSKVKKRVAPKRSGAKRKTPLSKGSDKKRLKVVSINLGKRGRKSSSSARFEASTSGTKKGSLSHGSKKVTEMVREEIPKNSKLKLGGRNRHVTQKKNCALSSIRVIKAQLAQPDTAFSKSLLTSLNDIISALLISLSNRPPASGPGLRLSRGSEKITELGGHNSQISEKNIGSVSALEVKKVHLPQPAMTLSKLILTSSNDEIGSVLGLLSLSNEPPATGLALPQSEPMEPETFVCVTNRNPSEFSTDIARNYMRSC